MAFDGQNLWYTFYASDYIYEATTSGSLIQYLSTNRSFGALAWDSKRKELWGGSYDGTGGVYTINPQTGAATFQFAFVDNTGVDPGYIDGLAYDPLTDTLWISNFLDKAVYNVSLFGTTLSSFPMPNSLVNSGIAVAGQNLWLADQVGYVIIETDKYGDLVSSGFGTDGFAAEGLAYDNVTFASSGECAIWANPATVGIPTITAFEVPCATMSGNATWSQLSPSTSPSARDGAVMAYDPATSQLLLFSGQDYNGVLNDTWTWNGTTWTKLNPSTSPPARYVAVMAYDPATSQLLLFGGYDGSSDVYDTWIWTGTTWSQLSPSTSPSARDGAVMAYDSATSQLLLFGGEDYNGILNDTWTWNGTTWTKLNSSTSPPARSDAVMAYDPATSQLLLFGGYGNTGLLNDTWTWNGTTWTELNPSTNRSYRYAAVMAYGPATGQLLLFGGDSTTGYLSDTWIWTGTTWSQLSPSTSPSARDAAVMAYDPATSQLLLFGGYGNTGLLNDTWTYGTADQAPAITSGNTVKFRVGSAGSFTVTTTGNPTPSLTENGMLPSGVTFTDNGNGTATLAGTSANGSAGTYSLTITASNGVSPNATQTFTLTVDQAPAITSGNAVTFTVGSTGSFTVTTSGYPTPSLTESGTLPSGVTFTKNGNGTATLSGTPQAGTAGSYNPTITASNGVIPNATQALTLTVAPAPVLSTITGQVTDMSKLPVAGVSISLGNGTSTTTDATGSYSFLNLPASSYTLTASKPGYPICPATVPPTVPPCSSTLSVSVPPNATANFTAFGDVLSAAASDLTTSPLSLYQGAPSSGVILTVNHDGPSTFNQVAVDFYLNDPRNGGTKIGTGYVQSLGPNTVGPTSLVPWAPAAGTYKVYAWIDPQSQLPLANRSNTIVSQMITVVSCANVIAPQVQSFQISAGGNLTTTNSPTVQLSTQAIAGQGGSSPAYLEFNEQAVDGMINQPVPGPITVQDSTVGYSAAQTSDSWTLGAPTGEPMAAVPGWHWVQVSAQGPGHCGSSPFVGQLINYLPQTALMAGYEQQDYAYQFNQGDRLDIFLTENLASQTGDPDVYLWGTDPTTNQTELLAYSNQGPGYNDGIHVASLPWSGFYLIEIYNSVSQPAIYQLQIDVNGVSVAQGGTDASKAIQVLPLVQPGSLSSLPYAPYRVYLPFVVRGANLSGAAPLSPTQPSADLPKP